MSKNTRKADAMKNMKKEKRMILSDAQEQQRVLSPLSAGQLEKTLGGRANIKSLSQIDSMTSLDQVLNGFNHVILYIAIQSPTVGHWIAMFVNSGSLYYCDSYGLPPLAILEAMKQKGLPTFGQSTNLLTLISKSQFANSFFYNTVCYQQKKDDVETCGRYAQTIVALNQIYEKERKEFNLDEFYQLMMYWKTKYNKSFDDIIVNF